MSYPGGSYAYSLQKSILSIQKKVFDSCPLNQETSGGRFCGGPASIQVSDTVG